MANKRDHDHSAAQTPSRPARGQAQGQVTDEAENDEAGDDERAVPALAGGRVKSAPPPPMQAFPPTVPNAPPRLTSTATPPTPAPPVQALPEGLNSARPPRPEAATQGQQPGDDDRVEYRPSRKLHICEAGPVALSNWVGRVGTKFVRFYRGAQASSLPGPVTSAMKESGVDVGLVTYEELGLRQPPAATLVRR
jgi:hypothetical protein